MNLKRVLCGLVGLLIGVSSTQAGLYYSGEEYASLPAQWRGFLLDQRSLRNIAIKPKLESEASPLRTQYRQEADKLQARARIPDGKLSADEWADLGALHIRLGETERAVEVLRKAHQLHPNHFAILANLGTAWQSLGDLQQSAAALEQAVRLAPGKWLVQEEAHLKLVRGRLHAGSAGLDDLFGIRYVGAKGEYEPGSLDSAQRKKLPANAVAVTQQLALWLPADGLILWQLAELANAHGDPRNAFNMMEGCVSQFGIQDPTLRKHRQILRDILDDAPKAKLAPGEQHEAKHVGTIAFRSSRALVSKLAKASRAPIDAAGINPIPWDLLGETKLDKAYKPTFPNYLEELKGKRVSMTGFMYPLREEPDASVFLFIEAPVGCWYCEMPETAGIVYVELAEGKTIQYQRGVVRVIGRLHLNATDPEDYLYSVKDARVGPID